MIAARLVNSPPHRPKESASIDALITQPEAAELLNVGRATVQRCQKVIVSGREDIIAQCDP